jgi:hypothetical protein
MNPRRIGSNWCTALSAAFLLVALTERQGFVDAWASCFQVRTKRFTQFSFIRSVAVSDESVNAVLDTLTPELRKIVVAFRNVADDQLRYKQLLYFRW